MTTPFVNQGDRAVPASLRKAIWELVGLFLQENDTPAQSLSRLNDLKSRAYDPSRASSAGTSQTTGRVATAKIPWGQPDFITGYAIAVATAGVTLTAGQNLMWLCDNNGLLIPNSVSVDQASAWQGTGAFTPAVAAGPLLVNPNSEGFLYVCILTVGTTIPLFRVSTNLQNEPNVGAIKKRFGLDAATGVTAAQNVTPATMANWVPNWVGVY